MASIYGNPNLAPVLSGLSLYIDPSKVPPNGTTVYDVNKVSWGTITNSGGTVYVPNQYGGVFSFNGTDQCIDLTSGLTFSAGCTFQVMLRRSNAGSGYDTAAAVFANIDGSTLSLYDSLGQQNYYIESSYKGATQVSPVFNNNIPDWYLVTLVNSYNNNSIQGDISLYKNNLSTAYTITSASIPSGTLTNLRIGGDPLSYLGIFYKGDIGAFLFYNRVLTLSEIAYNYNIIAKRFNV